MMLMRIAMTLMVCGLIALGRGAVADEKATQTEIKQARKKAACRTRRIIWNNDGDDIANSGTPEGFLAARHRQVADTQVDSVFYCTGTTFTFSHLNDVAEMFLDIPDDVSSGIALVWRDNMRSLKEAGTDTLSLSIDFCRRHELEFFYSMRMDDIHDSFMSCYQAQGERCSATVGTTAHHPSN